MPRKRNQRPKNVRYYAANRASEIERVRRRQVATTAFLRSLRDVPCADCGGRFERHQMDFDHREPSEKSFTLCSGRAALKSRDQIMAEALKCDVVCVNCHRLRSRRRHRARLALRVPAVSPRIESQRMRWRYHADLLDQLRSVPCADCGGRFAQCSMDFDHRDPLMKVARVPSLIGRAGVARILAEAAKCDIVCANCHRLRTFKRREGGAA
jgi:DNA-binding transcriptional regulator YdaS (Cro superfamily)